MAVDARPPFWVPAAIALVRRLPAGRYRMLHRLRRTIRHPFVAHLAPDLGALRFICDPRDSVAGEACFTGWYEPQESRICAALLATGDVFVDLGANWGYFSLVAARLVGRTGLVVSLEPEPRLFGLLSANLEMNGLCNVRALQLAAGEHPGMTGFEAFDADSRNWGTTHSLPSTVPASFHCATAPLDDLLDEQGVAAVQLVKIDVEGAEPDVLAGMRRGLAAHRYRYVLLECHPELLASRGIDARVCVDRLAEAGYRAWLVDHSPRMHQRAAAGRVPFAEMMRSYTPDEPLPTWPHLFAAAPGAPDPR